MAAPTQFSPITATDAVAAYTKLLTVAVAGHSLSPRTQANYTRDLHEFLRLLERSHGTGLLLDTVTGEDVDAIIVAYGSEPDGRYATPQGRTRGAGAQSRFRNTLNRFFRHAEEAGWVQVTPMLTSRVKPRARGLRGAHRKALPPENAAALLGSPAGAATHTRTDQQATLRDEFILRILMETGPRVSELCAADRADLSVREEVTWLHIRSGKGGKERWIPLSPETLNAYTAYLETERPAVEQRATARGLSPAETDNMERALLLTWRGRRMAPRDVQLMVERAVKRLPPEHRRAVTPHGLRHTAATLLLSSGAADIHTVQEILGHASIATTGIYLDTRDGQMAAAVAQHPITGTRSTT